MTAPHSATPGECVRAMDAKATDAPWTVEKNVREGGINHLAITNRAAQEAGRDWMACSLTPMVHARQADHDNGSAIATLRNSLPALAALLDAADALREVSYEYLGGIAYPEDKEAWEPALDAFDTKRAALVAALEGKP